MIEELLLKHFKTELPYPCYMEEPVEKPERYVIIEKTGSGPLGPTVLESMFAIQSYAESLFEAAKLNELVKTAIKTLVLRDEICRIDLNSDYNFTNTKTKQYRYQAVFEITHYEEA